MENAITLSASISPADCRRCRTEVTVEESIPPERSVHIGSVVRAVARTASNRRDRNSLSIVSWVFAPPEFGSFSRGVQGVLISTLPFHERLRTFPVSSTSISRNKVFFRGMELRRAMNPIRLSGAIRGPAASEDNRSVRLELIQNLSPSWQ